MRAWFWKVFLVLKKFVYFNDADGLFGTVGQVHNPEEWELFIDSSKANLRAVFFAMEIFILLFHWYTLFTRKRLMEVCILCPTALTVTSTSGRYVEIWRYPYLICSKITYTKYCTLLRKWDSHNKKHHYVCKDWHQQCTFTPGKMNISCKPLTDPLSPPHMNSSVNKDLC